MRVYRLLINIGGLVIGDEAVVIMTGSHQIRIQRRNEYASGSSHFCVYVQNGNIGGTLQLIDGADEPARFGDLDAAQREQVMAQLTGGGSQSQQSSFGMGSGMQGLGGLNFSSIIQSISNNQSAMMSSVSSQSSTSAKVLPCQIPKQVPIVWEPSANDLVPQIEICMNTTVPLGHSFAEMSERETYLREESGVFAGKDSVEGPNNALGEVRILLADKVCQTFEIAVRFADKDGRNLLFRSTAGHVLIADPENGQDKLRTHVVKAKLTNAGYKDEETFVHAGALSFFVQNLNASTEPRLLTPENYEIHHEGKYRELVQGLSNAQQYHHSEQAFFKLLYDYPNAVSDAINETLNDLVEIVHPFITNPPIRICAISVDIFTTRAACSGCQKSSQAIQIDASHFFVQALRDVAGDTYPVPVEIDPGIRRLVRITCARAFVGTPDPGSVKKSEMPKEGTIHALPEDPISRPIIDQSGVHYVRMLLDVNHTSARPLLRKGTERSEVTWVQRCINQVRTLDPKLQIKTIHQWWKSFFSNQARPSDMIILAAELMQLEEKMRKPVIIHFGQEDRECFAQRRIRFAAHCWVSLIAKEKLAGVLKIFCYLLVRNYKSFLENDPYMPFPELKGRFNGPKLINFIAYSLQTKLVLETEDIVLLQEMGVAIYQNREQALVYCLDQIEKEIAKELEVQSATSENRALNLAIEFGLTKKFTDKRPGWGGIGAHLSIVEEDMESSKPIRRVPDPAAEKFLIEQGHNGAVEKFRKWLIEHNFTEGSATGLGNNCAFHTMHQFGNGDTMQRDTEAAWSYNSSRIMHDFEIGTVIPLENMWPLAEERNLCVYVYKLQPDGTVSPAGILGKENQDKSNVRHMLHVGLHYEPLWKNG